MIQKNVDVFVNPNIGPNHMVMVQTRTGGVYMETCHQDLEGRQQVLISDDETEATIPIVSMTKLQTRKFHLLIVL